MESRKLQKVGRSTLTVSLPARWIKENGIKPGDLVFIVPERDGTLKIVPSQRLHQEEIEEEYIVNADLCGDRGLLERIIVGAYILGKNVIRITSASRIKKDHMGEIRRIVRKLIGLGILEETENNILLHCSLDPAKFNIDMLVRRLALIVLTVFSDSLQALLKNDEEIAREAIEREEEADVIYYLATRLLLSAQEKADIREQIGLTNALFIPALRSILQSLELVGDYSEEIAKKTILLSKKYRDVVREDEIKRIYRIGEKAHEIIKTSIECVFSGDIKLANTVLEMKNSLKNEIETLFHELPEIPYLRTIVSCISSIAHVGSISAEIAINRALGEQSKYIKGIVEIVKHSLVKQAREPTKNLPRATNKFISLKRE